MLAADLASLSPEDRRQQLARILARGLLRCSRRPGDPNSTPKNLSETGRDGLAIPGETRLSVHTG
jgi:hypothetical protein